MLARYKFVAKMLEGYTHVLEIGCGDGFASEVVRQHVTSLVCTDVNEELLDIARARRKDGWAGSFRKHNLVTDGPVWLSQRPFPIGFEAAYSLDVLEHIKPEEEHVFLDNLRESVSCLAIVGMPSLESQAYASSESRKGHVNCKTASSLRGVMRRHFRTVLMFGMNDETLTTGFDAMRHYNIAIGIK